MSFNRSLLLAALAALQPVVAAAQLPTFAVAVTEPVELIEEVGTTRRITRADIETRNARTLDEALRLLPGVHVRTGGDGTPRIDVRGFRSRHVLLLVNGVLVNSTADGQFDPARMSTQGIREIKVSYGSSSVLYGDNALAAVIEVTTVDATPEATFELSGGTPGQLGGGGRYARSAGDWSFAVAASGFDTDGYRLPSSFTPASGEDGGIRENSDRRRTDVRGGFGYRVSPLLSLASEWNVAAGRYGVPGSVVDDAADVFAQAPRYERVNDYRAVSGQVSAVIRPSSRLHVRTWAYRNRQREDRARYDDRTYSSMDDPLVPGTFQSREYATVTGSSALGRIDLLRLGWVRLAVNQRREAFESGGVVRDVRAAGGGGGGGGGRGGGAGSPAAAFDVRTFALDQHVDVYSSGAEWQVRTLGGLGIVLGAAANTQRRPNGMPATMPSWIAGASYQASDALRLHASATRKVRMPSLDQLFDTGSGNPLLRPEQANAVDAGATYRLDESSTGAVSVFSTHARDFIERVSGSPFENQERYRFRGAEFTMETSIVPRLSVRGAYTLLDADDLAAEPVPLQTRPRHRLAVDWVWTPVPGTAVRGAAVRTGSQFFDSRGGNPVQMRAPGYTLLDLGVTRSLVRRFDVAVDVTNVLDERYEQSYGLPREGRAARLTLRVRVD